MHRRHALELWHGNRLLYSDDCGWLVPLFGLRAFLRQNRPPLAELTLYDRIIGRAAALMLVALGIRHVKAGLLSAAGEEVLLRCAVDYRADRRTEGIFCRSEQLLAAIDDPEQAWRLIEGLRQEGQDSQPDSRPDNRSDD